jgi:hypothetical protein
MHMASALGVPIVTLFGPKDDRQTGPYCSRSIVVTADVHCRPCTKRRCAGQRCMTAIGVEPVVEGALAALDGGGECRADRGPSPGAFSTGFVFGRWRGEISTHCSMPEFYTRICEPDDLIDAGGRPGPREADTTVSLPAASGRRAFRVVRRPPTGSLSRALVQVVALRPAVRAWRAARGLAAAAVPAIVPACLVSRTEGLSHEDVLLTEDFGGGPLLRHVLDGSPGWDAMDRTGRAELVEATAGLLRDLHRAGYCHLGLRPRSIIARRENGAWQLRLTDLECTIYVGRLPRIAADVLFGMDLGRLVGNLGVRVSRAEALRFFRAYRTGFMEDTARWRCLLSGIRLTAGGRGMNPWLRRLRVG